MAWMRSGVRSPSAPLIRTVVVAAFAVTAACKSTESTPSSSSSVGPSPAVSPTGPTASGAPSASASVTTDAGVRCGSKACAAGEVCCNASCGICTPPGAMCIQQFCGDVERAPPASTAPADAGAPVASFDRSCKTDADCRLHYNWCGELPCTCNAHSASAKTPTCTPPVKAQCFMDPCQKKSAVCRAGTCTVK